MCIYLNIIDFIDYIIPTLYCCSICMHAALIIFCQNTSIICNGHRKMFLQYLAEGVNGTMLTCQTLIAGINHLTLLTVTSSGFIVHKPSDIADSDQFRLHSPLSLHKHTHTHTHTHILHDF